MLSHSVCLAAVAQTTKQEFYCVSAPLCLKCQGVHLILSFSSGHLLELLKGPITWPCPVYGAPPRPCPSSTVELSRIRFQERTWEDEKIPLWLPRTAYPVLIPPSTYLWLQWELIMVSQETWLTLLNCNIRISNIRIRTLIIFFSYRMF